MTLTSAGTYSVVVSGACNSVTNFSTLFVNTPVTSRLTVSSLALCPGNNGTLSTTASGTGPFSYVWSRNGAPLASQTSNSFTIILGEPGGCGHLQRGGDGRGQQRDQQRDRFRQPADHGDAVAAPYSGGVCPGSPASYSTVAGGTGPFTYEWSMNGSVLAGQTGSSFTIPFVAASGRGHLQRHGERRLQHRDQQHGFDGECDHGGRLGAAGGQEPR